MNKLRQVLEGLTILDKYTPENSQGICAVDSTIYAAPESDGLVTEEDAKRLEQLGWYKPPTLEGWAIYV